MIKKSGMDGSDFQEAAWFGTQFDGKQFGIPIPAPLRNSSLSQGPVRRSGSAAAENDRRTAGRTRKSCTIPNRASSGICWNGARGTPLGQTFIFSMGDYHQPPIDLTKEGGGFDIQNIKPPNMKPMIDSPAGHSAANFIHELKQYSPPGILNMAWDERNRVFNEGGCAMLYVWSALTAQWDSRPETRRSTARSVMFRTAGSRLCASVLAGRLVSLHPLEHRERPHRLAWKTIEWMTSK